MENEGTLGAVGVEHLSVPTDTQNRNSVYRVDIKSFLYSIFYIIFDLVRDPADTPKE